MYLSLTNVTKSVITGGADINRSKAEALKNTDHTYQRGDVESRGPCPCLNALANQGWLPRDGKQITLDQVNLGLTMALHMDKLAAGALTRSLRPLIRMDGTFDLKDTRRHNVIEHDASFTRFDFHQGDNYTFQPHMYEAMLNDAKGGPVTLQSLARTYTRRMKESRAAGAPRLSLRLWFVHILQCVSLLNVAQTGNELNEEVLEPFYFEERIPDIILNNHTQRTLFGQLKSASKMLFYVIFGSD